MLYLYISLILLCETAAITLLKTYSQSSHLHHLLFGLLFYGGVSLFLIQSFRYETIGIVNVIWSAFSVLFVASVGVLKFHERISCKEVLGMILAVAGIAILRL